MNDINIPWHRYAIITELAIRFKDKGRQFGKTALQKMVYLLQEIYGIDCGYNYAIYTYGPFTDQLFADLDLVELLGGVVISSTSHGFGGYRIEPGEKATDLCKKGESFLLKQDVQSALAKLIEEFAGFSTADLELRSTIVYVARELREKEALPTMTRVCKVTQDVKPRFRYEDIQTAVEELSARSYIQLIP